MTDDGTSTKHDRSGDGADDGVEPPGSPLSRLAREVRALNTGVRTAVGAGPALAEAAELVARANALLAPYLHPGPYMQAGFAEIDPQHFDSREPSRFFPYSPVLGVDNPISPPAELWDADGELRGRVTVPPYFNGPPDAVHGGAVAMILDELLGLANILYGTSSATGTLTIRYRVFTPVGVELSLAARHDRSEGRKHYVSGEILHGDTITAEAEGIFISPRDSLMFARRREP